MDMLQQFAAQRRQFELDSHAAVLALKKEDPEPQRPFNEPTPSFEEVEDRYEHLADSFLHNVVINRLKPDQQKD